MGDLSLGQHGHPPRIVEEAPINPMVAVVATASSMTRREDAVVDTLKAVRPLASSANSAARRRTPSFDASDVSMRPSLALHRKAWLQQPRHMESTSTGTWTLVPPIMSLVNSRS